MDEIGRHALHGGDCLAVLATLPEASVDVVVTSPPYNLDVAYATYRDSREAGEYVAWIAAVARALARVLRPDGSVFLNLAGSGRAPWLPFEVALALRETFVLQNHIAWIKSVALGGDGVGHFKPIPGHRFLHQAHEPVFHFTHAGDVRLDRLAIGVPFKDKTNIARRNHARDLRCRGDTWFIPYATVQSRARRFSHPATFPVELPLWCIFLHGAADPVVLDPFAGTGTTLVAAERAGGRGIGIEIDPAYRAAAAARVAEAAATTQRLQLDNAELAALGQPGARGGAGTLLLNLADRVNRTTGTLALDAHDIAAIRRHAGGAQGARLHAAFARHGLG